MLLEKPGSSLGNGFAMLSEDRSGLAMGQEASPPAIYEPEPGVAQELDGSRWVVDVDPAHRGHFLITPSPGQEPVEGVFRRDGVWVQGWQGQPEGIWREGRWLPGMPAPEALHFDPFRSWEDFGRTLGLRYGFPDLSDHHYTVPFLLVSKWALDQAFGTPSAPPGFVLAQVAVTGTSFLGNACLRRPEKRLLAEARWDGAAAGAARSRETGVEASATRLQEPSKAAKLR
eukprot:s8299_g4.t1